MSTRDISSQSEDTIVSAWPIRSQLCRPLIGVNMGGTHVAVASGGRMHQEERKSELSLTMQCDNEEYRTECLQCLTVRSQHLWSAVCYNLMIRSLMRMIFISCDHWSKSSHPVTRTRHRAPGKLSQAISLNTFFHYSCYFSILVFLCWIFHFHFRLNREARDNLFNCHEKGNHSSFHNSTHTISLKIDQLIGSKITYS